MVSTCYQISHKSPGNNSCKSFRTYLCAYSLFFHLLTYYIKLRRPKIYLLKEEKSLPVEIEIVFTLYCSLEGRNKRWNQEEIPRSSVFVFCFFFWEKSKGFWAATFPLELFGGSCQQKQDYGNSGRNCGHKLRCASLLKRPICTCSSSQKKGFSFLPIINAKWCKCLITSLYHDNISCSSTLFQSPAASFILPSQKKLEVVCTHVKKLKSLYWVISCIAKISEFRDHCGMSILQYTMRTEKS